MQKWAWDLPPLTPAQTARSRDLRQAMPAWKRWLAATALALLGLVAAAYGLAPPRYSAQAQIQTGPRPGGLIGLRASAVAVRVPHGAGGRTGQALLLSSRDLARRVISELGIENNREFDPGRDGLGLASRALIFLGIKRDPARDSAPGRVLEAFQERLRIAGPDKRGIITVSFQSENADLAARAANRLAELYVKMRADGHEPLAQRPGAHIIAFASVPSSPVPAGGFLFLAGTAAAAAFSACAAALLPRLALHGRAGAPSVQRGAAHPARIARFKLSERLNERVTAQSSPPRPVSFPPAEDDGRWAEAQFISEAAAAIKSKRAQPAGRRIRIFASQPPSNISGQSLPLALARTLAQEERTIALCLDCAAILGREMKAAPPRPEGSLIRALIAGRASFADVICRDPISRLHLLPLGKSSARDLAGLGQIADALAATYSFIVLISPDIEFDSKARTFALRSDFLLVNAGQGFLSGWQVIAAFAEHVLLAGPATDAGLCPSQTAA